jgi:hypothetical protein
MNDELQNKLAEVLGGIADGVSQAKDFAVEQLPDVAQQYIMFGLVWETAAFVVSFAVMAILCAGLFMLIKHRRRLDEVLVHFGATMLAIFAIPIWLIFVAASLKDLLLVWFAPKLYLLQGIAGLLK